MKTEIESAMEVLSKALKDDPTYRIGWQANIAMAFKDEFNKRTKEYKGDYSSDYFLHKVANHAANNFINTLSGDNKEPIF